MKLMRKLHKYSAYVVSFPLTLILISSFFLLLRKDLSFMSGGDPKFVVESYATTFDVLDVMKAQYNLSKDDITSITLSFTKGTYSVKDIESNQYILKADNLRVVKKIEATSFRKVIFSIHEGTFWGSISLYIIWLPTLIASLVLMLSGLYFIVFRKK